MKPFQQLLRRPVRLLAILILFAASSAFLCLGWGVLRSARATSDEMERRFVTLVQIAPSEPGATQRIMESIVWDEELGKFVHVEEIGDTGKNVDDLYDFIENSGCLRGFYRTGKTNAYVPQVSIHRKLSEAAFPPPRTGASMFVFTLTEIGDIEKGNPVELIGEDGETFPLAGERRVTIRGKVKECLALPEDYEAPSEIRVELSEFVYNTGASEKPSDGFFSELEIGKKYIVADYEARNWDLYARKKILDMLAMRFEDASRWTISTGTISLRGTIRIWGELA